MQWCEQSPNAEPERQDGSQGAQPGSYRSDPRHALLQGMRGASVPHECCTERANAAFPSAG